MLNGYNVRSTRGHNGTMKMTNEMKPGFVNDVCDSHIVNYDIPERR
jgi:hypothetical protein